MLAALPDRDGPLRARVLARLAGALQPSEDPDRPIAMVYDAIAMARRIDDPGVLLSVLHDAGNALVSYGEPSKRARLDREMLDLATAQERLAMVFRAHLLLVFDHLELGERARAEEHAEAYAEMARRVGRLDHSAHAFALSAMFATCDGRFDEDGARGAARRDVHPSHPRRHRIGVDCLAHGS